LRALLPDDCDLVKNVSPSDAKALRRFVKELWTGFGLDGKRGSVTWGPDERHRRWAKDLIRRFAPADSRVPVKPAAVAVAAAESELPARVRQAYEAWVYAGTQTERMLKDDEAFDMRKNTPRAGRPHGRSIVHRSEV
jgi:hypothetical protein